MQGLAGRNHLRPAAAAAGPVPQVVPPTHLPPGGFLWLNSPWSLLDEFDKISFCFCSSFYEQQAMHSWTSRFCTPSAELAEAIAQ